MVRYRPITKFEGLNEKGLTYNEAIQKDVESFIDSFLYYSSHITDNDGEPDWMNITNVSNVRFVLGIYYERELDLLVPENLAKELKKKIEDLVGIEELFKNTEQQIKDEELEITKHDWEVCRQIMKSTIKIKLLKKLMKSL